MRLKYLKKSLKSIWKILKLFHVEFMQSQLTQMYAFHLEKVYTQFSEMMEKKYVNWLVLLEHSQLRGY